MDLFTLVGKIAIDCTEAETKIDTLLAKAGQLNTALGGTSGSGGTGTAGSTNGTGTTSTTSASGNTTAQDVAKGTVAGNLWTQAVNVLGGWVIDLGKEGYAREVEREKYIVNLQALTNSTREEAEALFEELNQLSVDTPLNLDSIGYATTKLVEQGFATDDLTEAITVLGNVAKGDNNAMQHLTRAAMQIYSKGTLKAEEVEQLGDAGIPIYPLLADFYELTGSTQENNSYLRGIQENGGISNQDFWDALVLSQSAPGKPYYNQMALAMGTTKGINEQSEELTAMYSGTILTQSGFMSLDKWWKQFLNNFKESEINRITEEGLFGVKNFKDVKDLGDVIDVITAPTFDYNSYTAPDEVYGPPTPEGWTPDNSISKLETVLTKLEEVLNPEAIKTAAKEGVSEGLSGVTITTGNVTLNDGALVGRILPKINLGLGQMAVREMRG